MINQLIINRHLKQSQHCPEGHPQTENEGSLRWTGSNQSTL